MNRMFVLLALAGFLGCSAQKEAGMLDSLPRPVGETVLPPFPPFVTPESRLLFRVYVDRDGTVQRAELQTPTGDKDWDSLAVVAVLGWQFTPALADGSPVAAWIKMPVVVRFGLIRFIVVAEIVLRTRKDADSVSALLKAGGDFESLARDWSTSTSAQRDGYLGSVPLTAYSTAIQRMLMRMRDGETTDPVVINDRFVILKRIRLSR